MKMPHYVWFLSMLRIPRLSKPQVKDLWNSDILKPEEMLVRCRKYSMSGNFVFIRNAAMKNHKEDYTEKEARIILEESDMNVLIHAKGSKFTDSNASHSLMQVLRRKNKSYGQFYGL